MVEHVANSRVNRCQGELRLLGKNLDGRKAVKHVPDIDVMDSNARSGNTRSPSAFFRARLDMSRCDEWHICILAQAVNRAACRSQSSYSRRYSRRRLSKATAATACAHGRGPGPQLPVLSTAEWDARALLRGDGSDDEIADLVRDCIQAKAPAHGINTIDFVRPECAMYQIGG
jgi:hypothetical protein